MKRTYLALTGLALACTALPATLPQGSIPLAHAEGLFDGRPVDAANFAILARPVGSDDWTIAQRLAPTDASLRAHSSVRRRPSSSETSGV